MDFRIQLEMALLTILLPLLPLVAKYFTMWVNIQITKLQKEAEVAGLSELKFYLDEVDKTIQTAVSTVNQVFVEDLKENGLFTNDRHLEAFNQAKAIVLSLLTDESRIMLEKVHTDYLIYIDNKIQELVNISK